MNVQETTGIRELTADELDAVAGGMDTQAVILLIGVGAWVGGWIAGLLDSLFD
jgi:hypothetical protein